MKIYLNAGHGDFENGINYTFPIDGKFYHFLDAKNNQIFSAYEGMTNRIFAELMEKKLVKAGHEVIKVYHPQNDTFNQERISRANADYLKDLQNGKIAQHLWLSFHSNAIGNVSRGQNRADSHGFEVFTSIGRTASDTFASEIIKEYKSISQKYKVTNRGAKEANFFELVGTLMPAVLIENLFFTNLREAKLLLNESYQEDLTDIILKVINSIK